MFDVEASGDCSSDEICQLAAGECVNGRLERTMNVYIRPTCEMNPWAEQVHGISMDYLDEHGIDPEDALHQFFDFLGSDVLLVAHNNRFDLIMLHRNVQSSIVRLSRKGSRCAIHWRWLVTFARTSRVMRSATFLGHWAWMGLTAMTRSMT